MIDGFNILIIRPVFMSTPIAVSGDLIDELLLGMRLSSVQFRRIAMGSAAGVGFANPVGRGQFHFVGRGPAWLRSPDGQTHALGTGDALLIPRGGHHAMLSSPDAAPGDVRTFDPALSNQARAHGAHRGDEVWPSSGAMLFSGCMELDLGGMQPLVAAMPEVMRVDTLLQCAPEIEPMLAAMERESKVERAGHAVIMARLAEVVAALIVRGWVASGCGGASGWIGALRDPRLSMAIVAMHRQPDRDWTVAQLAKEASSSRSVFARRFLLATGVSPLRYLTELRMRLAVRKLSREGQSVEEVASQLGYGSLAAFSRAFKRTVGVSPGACRTACTDRR